MRELLNELQKRNPLLYWFGWGNIGLLAVAIVMNFIDPTLITGLPAWIKPMKFAISITIYAWTFAWLLAYLPEGKTTRIVSWGIVICMALENAAIFMQAFRGVTSHFNIGKPFDAFVFMTMGTFILINALIVLYTIYQFFIQKIQLDSGMLWAWRIGLIFFFLGGISGGIMSARLGHTVGTLDGGPGLPFLNWSTVAGDIRTAHFFTLHGLQIIPLMTMLLFQRLSQPKTWVIVFSATYFLICVFMHVLAFSGWPLVGLSLN